MISIGARIRSGVRSGLLVALALGVTAGAVAAGERHAGSVIAINAAGVSSGIDMALHLAARIAGEDFAQGIQLGIEYDPEPPFSSGSPDKAPAHVLAQVRQRMKTRMEATR